MQETKDRPYISASIQSVRLISESAQITRTDLTGTVSLEMRDRSTLEVRWELLENVRAVLAIIPTIDICFIEKSTDSPVVTYTSCHDVRFVVDAFTGFDPNTDLPAEAVHQYIEMAMWIARSKAQSSVRSMGMSQFTWPQKPSVVEVDESKEKRVAKPKKRRSPSKTAASKT